MGYVRMTFQSVSGFAVLLAFVASVRITEGQEESATEAIVDLEMSVAHSKLEEYTQNFSVTKDQVIVALNELDGWEVPYNLSHRCTAYLSGHDLENRPFWIAEVGKWDIPPYKMTTEDHKEAFKKYLLKMAAHVLLSINASSTPEKPVTKYSLLLDVQDYRKHHLLDVNGIRWLIGLLGQYRDWLIENVAFVMVVNVDTLLMRAYKAGSALFPGANGRISVFDTNRSAWEKKLKELVGEDNIPTWYGGKEDYKPKEIIG